MNKNPENIELMRELDLLFSRWRLFLAWRNAHSDGDNECSLNDLYVLEALQLSPGLTTKGLVKMLNKHFSQIAVQLKGLEEKGLIEIKREEGKRSAPIFLTESGTKRLAGIRSKHAGLTSHMMIGGGFSHGLARLNEEETMQLRIATGLLLERQERVMNANMFQPASVASFSI